MTGKDIVNFIIENDLSKKNINIGIVVNNGYNYFDAINISNDTTNDCIAVDCEDLSKFYKYNKN